MTKQGYETLDGATLVNISFSIFLQDQHDQGHSEQTPQEIPTQNA